MPDESSVIINMESMIKSLISSMERLREEMDLNKGMLDDILNNDPTYKEHSDLAKEATKVKSATKRQVLKQQQAAELAGKVQSLRSQIKENKAYTQFKGYELVSNYIKRIIRGGRSRVDDSFFANTSDNVKIRIIHIF